MTEQSVTDCSVTCKKLKEKTINKKQVNIVKAALKVFTKKGYNPVALDEIAKVAGIAKGTIYLYFQNKEDIFYHSILYILEFLQNKIKEEIDENDEFFSILKNFLKVSINVFKKNKCFIGMFFIIHNPKLVKNKDALFKILIQQKNDLLEFIKRIAEREKKSGVFCKNIDTIELAHLYVAIYYETIRRFGFSENPNKFETDKIIKKQINILKNGVLKKVGGKKQ